MKKKIKMIFVLTLVLLMATAATSTVFARGFGGGRMAQDQLRGQAMGWQAWEDGVCQFNEDGVCQFFEEGVRQGRGARRQACEDGEWQGRGRGFGGGQGRGQCQGFR